jgi:hypothetical protein
MGAETIPRSRFHALLAEHLGSPSQAPLPWPGAPQPDEVPA